MISATETLKQSVVVFSKNYLPISRVEETSACKAGASFHFVNIRRAIILLVTDKAEPIEFITGVSWEVRSPSLILQVPAHIRLKTNSTERVWKVSPVSRKEVLRRDRHQCARYSAVSRRSLLALRQYCASRKQLTLDHVIPRSKGGKHTWDNVVIACEACNCRKGDRTPQEAGMLLITQPKAPPHPTVAFAEQFWHETEFSILKMTPTGDEN